MHRLLGRTSALEHATLTDRGRRHGRNEDAVAVVVPPKGARWGFEIAIVVCDGVSGQARADAASALSIEAFRAELSRPDDRPLRERLVISSAAASAAILDFARREVDGAPVASTVVALLRAGPTVTIGHVGNSRAYLLRNGAMELLTADHSVVAEQVRQGLILPEEARRHPLRSRISRALGTPNADAMEVSELETRPRDIFLLCTDGLHDVVAEEKIKEAISEDLARSARRLVDLANGAGGPDNITVALCRTPAGAGRGK